MFSYLSPIPEVDSPPQDPMELDYASVAESTAVGDSDSSQEDEMVVPHREPSPAPSIAPSVYGFTQEMVDEIMESKYGRKVNIMCRTYSVAADDSELERQDDMHEIMKGAIGLVFGPVYDVLTRNDGTEKLVLDLGTGSASWLFEMAREFPSVEFVGIDLVPPKIDPATQPPNCRIELDNINLPLDHYYNTADFVHTRFISPGVENYGYLIEQVASILKPGGLFTIAEPVYHLYRRPSVESLLNPRARPGSPDYSAFAAWLHLVKICIHKNGGDTQVALMGRVWMKEHRSFEEVDSLEVFVPFGSYYAGVTENERHWNRFGPLLRENEFKYMLNARPLLLDHFPANLVEDAERKAVQELRDPSKPIWAKLTVQCYRRR